MALNLAQAKSALAELTKGHYTTDDLFNLVQKVDISASGSTTILYSGNVNGIKTSIIAEEMANNPNIRIINKTDAARFLMSDEFIKALGATQGFSLAQMRNEDFSNPQKISLLNWLYDGKIGPWAKTSERFIDATTGKVRILTEELRMGSVLMQTELPRLLQKFTTDTDITEIEGLTREKLIGLIDDVDMRNIILTRAAHNAILTKPTTTNFASFLGMTDEMYENLYKAAATSGDDHVLEVVPIVWTVSSGFLAYLFPHQAAFNSPSW